MRVKVIVSDSRPFFLAKYSERVGDDRQLKGTVLIEHDRKRGFSSFRFLDSVDGFDTLIEFFTCFLHNKAS